MIKIIATLQDKMKGRFFFNTGTMLFLVFCLVSYAFGEETEKITTIHIVTPAWPNQTNEDGTGLFFDIVRNVYEPVGIKMDYEIIPWKRAETMIHSNEADAMVDVLLNNAVLTPKNPINVIPQYVVFKKETMKTWEGIQSLDGKRVLWFRGYDFHKNPHLQGIQLQWEEIDEYAEAWNMLARDRTDFYLDVLMDIEKYIEANNVDMEPYRLEHLWNETTYMSFADSERSKKLIEIYDQRIIELFQSGELQKIFEKWDYKFWPEAWEE